jgi:hypothetical protein
LLIYIASLAIQSAIDMTINNQYSNIELTFSTYFIKDAIYHMQFPQKIDFKHGVKVNFITSIDQDTFGGALLYHLQRKSNNESDDRSDKDTSISAQLLVIWGHKFDEFYSHVWLIEHKSTLDWDKDKLKSLHNVYNSQYILYDTEKEWFLNDNTALKTKCETSRGGLEVNITISEETDPICRGNSLWIDSKR